MRSELRGGSWNNDSTNLRAANRNRNQPGNRNDNIGFRCVRDVKGRLAAFRDAGAGAVMAASGVRLHFRIAHRTQAARAAASNIKRDPRPCGSASEARPGLVGVLRKKIPPAPPGKKKGKGIKETLPGHNGTR